MFQVTRFVFTLLVVACVAGPANARSADGTVTLAGVVTDESGAPLAGARVEALAMPGPSQMQPIPFPSGRTAEVTSRRDGTFELRRLAPRVTYELRVRRAGYAPSTERVVTGPSADRQTESTPSPDVEIVLEPGLRAVGRVVDAADRPVAGAAVQLLPPPWEPPPGSSTVYGYPPKPDAATSGEDGRFAFVDAGRGVYSLQVRREGFAPATVPGLELAHEAALPAADGVLEIDLGEVLLVPGETIKGRVVDATGRVVEGADLVATPERSTVHVSMPMNPRAPNFPSNLRQTSDGEGRFAFENLVAGRRYDIEAKHPDHVTTRLAGIGIGVGVGAGDAELEVVMERAAVLRGRVIGDAGRPVPRVTVAAQPEPTDPLDVFGGGPPGAHDGTDEEGAFELRGVPAGTVRLVVHGESWTLAEPRLVEVLPGEEADGLELRAVPARRLTGVIRAQDGRPVPHAEVALVRVDVGPGGQGTSTHSRNAQADGTFAFGGVETGEVTVKARHVDHGAAHEEVQIGERGAHVELVLAGGLDVAGEVSTAEGEPAAGATVRLQGVFDPVSQRPPEFFTTRVDAAGEFVFPAVPEGVYRLEVEHEEHAPYRSEPLEVKGASVPWQRVVLEPAQASI